APPVVVVGSRTPWGREERAAARRLGGTVVHLLFGPPECGFGATSEVVAEDGPRTTIGRPLGHVAAEVLDRSGSPVPVAVPGELHLGGPGLARGVGNGTPPRHPTGLVARRLHDGRIEVLGPVAATTALRGFRVDRARIEAALGRHPTVRHVTLTVEEPEPGDAQLVAHVVPEGDQAPALGELRVHLWRELPGYAWPRRLVVVGSPAGEAAPAPPSPPTPQERLLAGLWADVLGVDALPVEENYWQRFSFLDAVARAREAGVRLDDAQVGRNRTIAALAADLAAAQPGRGVRRPTSLPTHADAV
ncbi:MAG TPA: AMP-binding protein, partial [Acidimicrobiales bacterium]|nr:AMP-binding protein [Acidimicrobiales bacterium]